MIYIVDGTEKFTDGSKAAEYITENMGDSAYADMLDECYGDIDICGYSYSASIAFERVDEIAYRCGRNDYYDSLSRDISDDIGRMDDEETAEFYGFEVEAYDDDYLEDQINDLKEEIADTEGEDVSEMETELQELINQLNTLREGI